MTLTTARWPAALLSLFLAVPLCCCGWHGLRAEEGQPAAAESCSLCHAAEQAPAPEEDGCPCLKDVTQRDLAPKGVSVSGPDWGFARVAEVFHLDGPAQAKGLDASCVFYGGIRPTGPPRLYLRHHALLH